MIEKFAETIKSMVKKQSCIQKNKQSIFLEVISIKMWFLAIFTYSQLSVNCFTFL